MDNHNSTTKDDNAALPIEFYKIFSIQEILNGSPELSMIFFSFLSPEESLEIVQSLFVSDPPSAFKTSKNIPTTQHYRWLLSCFISFFTSEIPNRKKFVLPNYFFNVQKKIQLSMYNSKTTNSINKLLSNPLIRMSNDHQIKLAKLLLALYEDSRPLFEWINESSKFLKGISLSTLFSELNFNCLNLYRVEIKDNNQDQSCSIFENADLEGIRFFFKDKKEIETFFSIPSNLIDGKPITAFQNLFFADHPYPYQYQYYELNDDTNDNIFSLLHSTFSEKKFFVDIVKSDISKSIEKNDEELQQLRDPSNIKNVKNEEYSEILKNNQNRLNETVKNSSILDQMQSWTFLSLFPDILKNYEQYYEQLESLSFASENIASKLFERLKNDRILFNKIHEWTGRFVNAADFNTKSLPFEIYDFIKNLDVATVYSLIEQNSLLCLSDDDKTKDCDFLYGYFAISNELKTILVTQEFDQIEPIAEQIGFCIERIKSVEKKNSIIIDLFSLLFLTEKDHFLFQTLSMQTISQILINNANEKILPYLSNGLAQIQLFQQSNKKSATSIHSFEDLFISSKNKLINALIGGNIVFAENLAKTSSESQKLYSSYKTVKDFRKQIESNRNSELNLNDSSNSSFVNLDEKPINEIEEVALSVEGQFDLFDRIKKESEISEVIQLSKSCNYKKPFKICRTFSKKKFEFLKEKLENKNETKWTTPSFLLESEGENLTSNDQQIIFDDQNKLNGVKLLRGFFEYLDLLIPTLLSPGETIETVLNKNVDEILDEFLNKEEFEKADKLSEKMKVDIRKKVLSSLKYGKKCYEHYSDGLSPVLTTLSILGNWKDSFEKVNPDEASQKVIIKLLGEKDKKENLRKFILNIGEYNSPKTENINDEIEFKDDFFQDGFNVSEKVLSEVLESNNNDMFIELSYRSKTEDVEKVFNDHLNDETIEHLIELIRVCPVSFEFQKKCQLLYELHSKYSCQISNINQSFIDLLTGMDYFEASKFYACFPSCKDEFDGIVRQVLKNSLDGLNRADVGIVVVAPHMRQEILDFFSNVKVQEEEESFIQLMPVNWIYMNDFEETVKANICNDPDGAIELLKEFNLLDCDSIIIEYLDQIVIQNVDLSSIEKIDFLRQECHRFSIVVRNMNLLQSFIDSHLLNIMSDITVDSENAEFELNQYLNRLMNFLNSRIFVKKNCDKKVTSLVHFCSQFFFTKFHSVYSLNEIESIIFNCADNGYYSIVHELFEAFDVDITEKSFEIYLKQFRLCVFNKKPVLSFSLKENKLGNSLKNELQLKCSNEFAFYASKPSEFNGELIQKLAESVDGHKENDVCNSVLVSPTNPYLVDHKSAVLFGQNEQKSDVFEFFSNQSDIETATRFYVTDIEKGFVLLENLNEKVTQENELENQRKIGFVSLFGTSLSFSKLNIFMKLLRQFDPSHDKYSCFLKPLYDDCQASSHPFLKFGLSQIMGDFLTTAKTAIKVYTIKPDLAYLDIAESSLNELTNYVSKSRPSQNSEGSQIKIFNLNLSDEKVPILLENIKKTLSKISLQRQFIVFCIERRISDYESFNIFHRAAAIGSIVTLLFKNNEFRLSIEILRTLNQPEIECTEDCRIEPSQEVISDEGMKWFNPNASRYVDASLLSAAFSIANDGFDAVLKFAHLLQRDLQDEKVFEKIIYAFIKQFESYPFNEIDWIKQIALNVVKNNEFKVKILIEIEEFDLAADIVTEKKNKLDHLLPLIAKMSFARSNMNAFYKCQKALEYSV